MNFEGFTQSDFEVFQIEGLDERMEALREQIQPKFRAIGEVLTDDVAAIAGNEMFLHIAKHARRTKNPPKDSWLAIAENKRGYKKHPHFQVGLFDDHVFIWLAYIYELPHKTVIAEAFLKDLQTIQQTIPDEYVISLDHTKKDAKSLADIDLEKALERFRDVKKGEFLIGRHLPANDPLLQNGEKFLNYAKETFETVFPLYQKSRSISE